MRRLLLLLLLLIIGSSCSKKRDEQTFVLFLGDSITAGLQVGGEGSQNTYPEQAIKRLNEASNGQFSWAMRGYPSKPAHWFLKNRFTGVMDSLDDAGYKHKIATIYFGANDLVFPGEGRSFSPDSAFAYNALLADSLKRRGYEVIISQVMNITYDKPVFAEFNARRLAYNSLLKQHRSQFLDIVDLQAQPHLYAEKASADPIYFSGDHIHPGLKGQELLGLQFARTIARNTHTTLR